MADNNLSASPAVLADRAAFRADLEGLRAVAVLLVVAFHARFSLWSGGFVGVDVFFVLSGYLITGLLVHEVERTGRIGLLRFYARRARRLLPASALVILGTVAAEALLLSPLERTRDVRAAMAASVYLANVYFHRQSASYFSPDSGGNAFLHMWSLGVEEQFYLGWPLLIAVCFAIRRSRKSLAMVLCVLSVASLGLCLWLARVNQPAAFYEAPARAWEFGIGGLAALVPSANALVKSAWRPIAEWMGFFAIAATGALLTASTPYPGLSTLLPVIGTATVLIAGAGPSQPGNSMHGVARLLRMRPLQAIGRVSYSFYLWHWPVLVLGMALMPAIGAGGRLLLIAISFCLAVASYAIVENPIRYSRPLAGRSLLTLALAAMVTGTTLAATRWAERSAKAEAATPAQQRFALAAASSPRTMYDRGCLLDYADEILRDCTFANVASPTVMVLFGDSHMAQWFSAYEAVAKARGWRLDVLTKSGCPPALVAVGLWTMHRAYPECTRWRDAALQRILAVHPAVVVLAASDGHVNAPGTSGGDRLTVKQWQDGMRRTLVLLDSAGIRTVVLHDSPGLGFDVPTCLARALSHGQPLSKCSRRGERPRHDVYDANAAAASGLRHVSMLDLTDHFCEGTTCGPMRNGIIMYRDPGHISDAYARTLAPYVLPR